MMIRPHSSIGKPSRGLRVAVVIAVGVACCSAHAQTASPAPASEPAKQTSLSPSQPSASSQSAPAADPREQRRQQLIADTVKLYKLAAELKIEVDKSSKDTLSLTAIKKAEEIEKLARKLRGGKTGP